MNDDAQENNNKKDETIHPFSEKEETGEEFLRNILEKGGSENAMDLFKKFRGREPEIEALLRHSGLA